MTYDPDPLHDIDPRVTCHACDRFKRARHCGNPRAAGLNFTEVGPVLAALKQHCPGYIKPAPLETTP